MLRGFAEMQSPNNSPRASLLGCRRGAAASFCTAHAHRWAAMWDKHAGQSFSALCMGGNLLSVQKWILFEDVLTHVLVFNSPFQLMT